MILFIGQVIVVTVLMMAISIIDKGMYLVGIPLIEDVKKVTITYPKISNEIEEIGDAEHIELAVKLTGFLRYSLFEKADLADEPLITITYYLNNGKSLSVSANDKTVWWKSNTHAIKEEGLFIKLTEGIFFSTKTSF